MAASKAALEQLHLALCAAFDDVLTNGVKEIDKESGELVKVTAPAAYLNVIRQFIKDNDIKAPPMKGSALEAHAAGKPLPFAGSDHPANHTEH